MSIADRCCHRCVPEFRDLRFELTEQELMRDLTYPRDLDEESSERQAVSESTRPPVAPAA